MSSGLVVLDDILQRRSVWRAGAQARAPAGVTPSGFAALDRELPDGGWPDGALTEVLGAREGVGELQLVLPALRRLTRQGRRAVWLAPPHLPYAPALAVAGVVLEQLTVVRAPGRRDALWAAEQVLRSGSGHMLLLWMRDARYAELRRLALAAEGRHTVAFVFRPSRDARESSPASLRVLLESGTGGLELRVLKRRGTPCIRPLSLFVDRPVHAPVHAMGGASFSPSAARKPPARACIA